MHTDIVSVCFIFFQSLDKISLGRNYYLAVKHPPPYLERNLQKPDRLALNRVSVLKWAYDPIINPPVVVVLVINVEQQQTVNETQADDNLDSFKQWTSLLVREIMDEEIKKADNSKVDMDSDIMISYVTGMKVLAKAIVVVLQREEAPTLAPCGCETRSRTDLSVGWHRCGEEA